MTGSDTPYGELVKKLRGYNTPDRTIDRDRQVSVDIHAAADAIEALLSEMAPPCKAGVCKTPGRCSMAGVCVLPTEDAVPSAIGPSQEAIDFEEASRDHRDAERYRWLLEQWSTHHGAHHVEWRFDIGCAEVYGLEALIDKAMEAK